MSITERPTNAEVSREEPEVSGGKLEFEKLSEVILGCAIKVQRARGPGLLESTYQACLAHELRKTALQVLIQVFVDIQYDDLVIENAYRFAGMPLGILLNFWAWPLKSGGIKRVLNPKSSLRVLIDDRERGTATAEALRSMEGVACEFRRLQVGDYEVDGRLLVERKTLLDLQASIEDGRLFRQAIALANRVVPRCWSSRVAARTWRDRACAGKRSRGPWSRWRWFWAFQSSVPLKERRPLA